MNPQLQTQQTSNNWEEKRSQLQTQLRDKAGLLARGGNSSQRESLKTEIKELKKRLQLVVQAEREEKLRQEATFREYARFKYDHVTPEEQRAICDLGAILGFAQEELYRNFSAFAQVLEHTPEKQVLLEAITRKKEQQEKQQKSDQVLENTEFRLSETEKALHLLRQQNEQQNKVNSSLRAERRESQLALREFVASARDAEERNTVRICELLSELDQTRMLVKEQNDQLSEQREAINNLHLKLRGEKATSREFRSQITEEQNRFFEGLAVQKMELVQWKAKAEQCQQAFEHLRQERDDLQHQIDTLHGEIDSLEHQVAAMEKELLRHQQVGTRLREELLTLNKQAEEFEREAVERATSKNFHLQKILRVYQGIRDRWTTATPPQFSTEDERFYGGLLAHFWTEVNRSGIKSPAVLEKRISQTLNLPDWRDRFTSTRAQRAIAWCNSYQRGTLPFEEVIPFGPAQSFPELFRCALEFLEHATEWKNEWEFQLFQRGEHPRNREIHTLFKNKRINHKKMTLQKFQQLKSKYTDTFRGIDDQLQKGVE